MTGEIIKGLSEERAHLKWNSRKSQIPPEPEGGEGTAGKEDSIRSMERDRMTTWAK